MYSNKRGWRISFIYIQIFYIHFYSEVDPFNVSFIFWVDSSNVFWQEVMEDIFIYICVLIIELALQMYFSILSWQFKCIRTRGDGGYLLFTFKFCTYIFIWSWPFKCISYFFKVGSSNVFWQEVMEDPAAACFQNFDFLTFLFIQISNGASPFFFLQI